MGELIGIARFRFHPGRVEEYKRLSTQAMDIVRAKERGTLEYAIYFNEDESEAVVIERFTSSEALIEHGANMSEISPQVLATATVEGELLGEPNDELRAKLTWPEPELFTPWMSLKPKRSSWTGERRPVPSVVPVPRSRSRRHPSDNRSRRGGGRGP